MPDRSRADVRLDVNAARGEAPGALLTRRPVRILILGDFAGRGPRTEPPSRGNVSLPPAILVDRDNLDAVLARLQPAVEVDRPGAAPAVVRFREMDDFHPDALYSRTALFEPLRRVRDELRDPQRWHKVARQLSPGTSGASPAPRSTEESAARLSRGGLLDQMLEGSGPPSPAETHAPSPAPDDLAEFIRRSVAPYLVPAETPEQKQLVGSVERAIGDGMRNLMHHPDFQALEAAWRGLDFLLRILDTGTEVKVYLLNVSRSELAADALREDLESSQFYRLLARTARESAGSEPWSMAAGIYTFGESPADLELLAILGRFAAATGTPFLSAASPRLLGCESLAEVPDPHDWEPRNYPALQDAWQRLRARPEARFLGLALPRFLVRLPYGAESDPTETFPFEEMPGVPEHSDYLWTNPAFACLSLAGAGGAREIEGLPVHTYRERGEIVQKPCAEAFLSERAAGIIGDCGLMPLVSVKHKDAARMTGFRSLSMAASGES